MINRELFFNRYRKHFGRLKQAQVDGIEAVLNYWDADDSLTDNRHLAYILATDKHETANTFQAIEEYGKGKGRPYGKIDKRTGHAYYGRGLVQLTWYDNYLKMGKILGIDLVNNPKKALELPIAVDIIFEGMMTRKSFKGDFTGKSLENYFNKTKDDPINARRIVNGTDKAKLIAGYHHKFLDCIVYAKSGGTIAHLKIKNKKAVA